MVLGFDVLRLKGTNNCLIQIETGFSIEVDPTNFMAVGAFNRRKAYSNCERWKFFYPQLLFRFNDAFCIRV